MRYNAACGIGYYPYTDYVLYFFRCSSERVKEYAMRYFTAARA